MKYALITDLHFGRYKGDYGFLKSQLDFLNYFIEYVSTNKIDKIVIMGDVWDNRNMISLYIFNMVTDNFFKYLPVETEIILGNHDMFHVENEEINLVKYLENVNSKIKFVNEVKLIRECGKKMVLTPFLYNEDKIKDFKSFLSSEVRIDYIFGHFEIDKAFNNVSLKMTDFEKYTNRVYSGHYHGNERYKEKNCIFKYIGVPFQLDRNDMRNKQGFTVLDITTGEEEFIENNMSIKFKDIYFEDLDSVNSKDIKNNIINVIIKKSVYESLADNTIERNMIISNKIDDISKLKPYSIKRSSLNDTTKDVTIIDDEKDDVVFYNMGDLFDIWIDNANIPKNINKENIRKLIKEKLNECESL